MASFLSQDPLHCVRLQSESVLVKGVELKAQRSKLTDGKVIEACTDMRDALAALTKTLVELDFIVGDIMARAQLDSSALAAAIVASKRKEPEEPEADPPAKRSTPFGEPAMTACIK